MRFALAWTSVLVCALHVPAQTESRPEALEVTVERDVEYGVAKDVSLRCDVYRPKETPEALMPAVIWIHGGGWRGGDKAKGANAMALAKRGFVALSVNYRLSGVAPFPAAVEDCKCAVRWLRASAEEYHVDPDRIGVWGGSAGGHLALMVGCADEKAGLEGKGGYARVSSRVQAVCSWYGPADLTVLTDGASEPVSLFLGGSPAEKPEASKAASPVTWASKDDPPVLMVHGEKDALVPIDQSERMLKALTEAGAEAELVRVKNAGHGWQASGGRRDPSPEAILERCLEFFEKCLKSK